MLKKINKHKKLLVGVLVAFIVLFGGLNVYANGGEEDSCNPCEDAEEGTICIPNPTRFCSIKDFLNELTNLLIQLGLALVVFMVTLGGAFYMFGGANPDLITKGKNIIKWTILGVVIVIFARAILALISYVIGG